LLKYPAGRGFHPIFTYEPAEFSPQEKLKRSHDSALNIFCRSLFRLHCTNSCHPLVDALHTIENAALASRNLSLTKKFDPGKTILVL
jgi:hypothetical protein